MHGFGLPSRWAGSPHRSSPPKLCSRRMDEVQDTGVLLPLPALGPRRWQSPAALGAYPCSPRTSRCRFLHNKWSLPSQSRSLSPGSRGVALPKPCTHHLHFCQPCARLLEPFLLLRRVLDTPSRWPQAMLLRLQCWCRPTSNWGPCSWHETAGNVTTSPCPWRCPPTPGS